MNHIRSENPARPILLHGRLALLIAAALAGSHSKSAAAQPADVLDSIRIAVTADELKDARSLAKLRRQIAIAADMLCESQGLAAIYRNSLRRCREEVFASTEQQLQRNFAVRLAGLERPRRNSQALNDPTPTR